MDEPHPSPGPPRLLDQVREALGVRLEQLDGPLRAKPPHRIPVVLTPDEVRRVLERLEGPVHLIAASRRRGARSS